MPGLEQLFTFGNQASSITLAGTEIRLIILDARRMSDAFNMATGADENARLLDYKKQILARAITHANGESYFEDDNHPKKEEIRKVYDLLNGMHVLLVNKLYDEYDKLDTEVREKIEEEVKKS